MGPPFHRGDRVRLTAEGRALFTRPPGPARIVGFGRDGLTVRVRHDDARAVVSYFAYLLERVEGAAA